MDRKYLGGENFLTVNYFLGHTRIHIRRYVQNQDGELGPTKHGVSLSPIVWDSLCKEVRIIYNHKSTDKIFVIERDLCISKQVKDGFEVYVFQRLFQRKNLSLQFVLERVVLRACEFVKLMDNMNIITDRVKEGLITYTLAHYMAEELSNIHLEIKPKCDPGAVLQLLESLSKCLTVSISLKITEMLNCFGCRESFSVDFMHDCVTKSRAEKFTEHFDKALYSINMRDVAKDIVHKNLNIDFDYVLGQEEFFDALDVKKVIESIEKMYIGENLL